MSLAFEAIKPSEFLLPNYYRTPIEQNSFKEFRGYVHTYQQNLIKFGSENEDGLVANAIVPFLQQCGFQSQTKYKQKGKSEIDLVLSQDSKPKVIIEAKKWQSNEFFTSDNTNCKALHECVLYFFRELDSNNFNISFLIITNFREFYVFNAKEFKRLFWENKAIQNLWKAYKDDTSLMSKNTQDFYENLREILDSKEFRDSIPKKDLFDEIRIYGIHLNIADLSDTQNDTDRIYKDFYKVFHRDFLYNEFSPNDANILNERFYNELLYILGLEEVTQNGKVLIKPSKESKAGNGTLYANILENIKRDSTRHVLRREESFNTTSNIFCHSERSEESLHLESKIDSKDVSTSSQHDKKDISHSLNMTKKDSHSLAGGGG